MTEPVSKKTKIDDGTNKVVTREEWLVARKDLLKKEKDFNKLRDELTKERQSLPWVAVDNSKEYKFQPVSASSDADGEVTLSDLFVNPKTGKSFAQLIVYHFMLGPGWKEGCKSCSYISDHLNEYVLKHLEQRDIRLVVVSRAPPVEIKAFQERMGWTFDWYSSSRSTFNFDYKVSFTQEQVDNKTTGYNYNPDSKMGMSEGPGLSVFYKKPGGGDSVVYHTYSTYSRGLDMLLGAYNFMDLCPKGRDEEDLSYGMAWVKRHDEYDDNEKAGEEKKSE